MSLLSLERTFKYAIVKLCYDESSDLSQDESYRWARFVFTGALLLSIAFMLLYSYHAEYHDAIISNGVLASFYLAALTYFSYMQLYVWVTQEDLARQKLESQEETWAIPRTLLTAYDTLSDV